MLVGNARSHPATVAGRSWPITVGRTIGHLLVGEEVCLFTRGRERVIPHGRSAAGASCMLGNAMRLASFRGLTVQAARGSKAPDPGLGCASLTAVAVAPALAPAA